MVLSPGGSNGVRIRLYSRACRTKIGGKGVFKGILGLSPAKAPGIEDLDCTEHVQTHGDWCKHLPPVLRALGLDGEREGEAGAQHASG